MSYLDKADKSAYELSRYYKIKQEAIEYLGGECVKCGATDNLQFDHIDPTTKKYSVSRLWSISFANRQEELDKCQLLCGPCHKDKHGIKEHGYSMYKHRGCRCDICRAGLADYTREYRAKYGRKY